MTALAKVTAVEAKLFLRDPTTLLIAVITPSAIMLILGMIPAMREPSPTFGGMRFVDMFAPSLVVVTLATLGVNSLPVRLATYREKGVLRRLSATPVHPSNLLIAQLVVNLVAAIAAIGLLLAAGNLAFDVPFPQHLLGFVAACLFGGGSLFALGLLAAATVRTARGSAAYALPIFFVSMFAGGVYLPRFLLPDWLVTVGSYMPPGVQILQDAWTGTGPAFPQLVIMAAIAVVAAAGAAKLFRWE